jgi:hypothetical protein
MYSYGYSSVIGEHSVSRLLFYPLLKSTWPAPFLSSQCSITEIFCQIQAHRRLLKCRFFHMAIELPSPHPDRLARIDNGCLAATAAGSPAEFRKLPMGT